MPPQYVGSDEDTGERGGGGGFRRRRVRRRVREGVARIEELMATELGKADELMTEAVQHLFQAGGKRFRPLFTVLSAQLGPEPDASEVTSPAPSSSWSTSRRCTTTT